MDFEEPELGICPYCPKRVLRTREFLEPRAGWYSATIVYDHAEGGCGYMRWPVWLLPQSKGAESLHYPQGYRAPVA